MLKLHTVLALVGGATLLLGAYALATFALLSNPIPRNVVQRGDLGETPVQAAVDYLGDAAAADGVTVKALRCHLLGETLNKVFVRCRVTDTHGHYTLDATLLKTMWRGIDVQPVG